MNRLGQHFLKNKSAIRKIVEVLQLQQGEIILEIGAGHGELTLPLAEACEKIGCKIVAIEKDPKLATRNIKHETSLGNTKIIQGDALKLIPALCSKFRGSRFKIVGNIPYYLTGHLLRIIGELKNKPRLSVFTIQKEVAERIVAEPPKMNRLAASVQFWAEPKIMAYISKRDFDPEPEVNSAIIRLKIHTRKHKALELDYYRTVKNLFGQPRKTILNNLCAGRRGSEEKEKIREKLQKIGINPQKRPQDLSVKDVLRISNS